MSTLTIIVPTRSRPQNVAKVVEAWTITGAFEQGAELLFVVDGDDPELAGYEAAETDLAALGVAWSSPPTWRALVPKLNAAAVNEVNDNPDLFAIGFAGDDHLPRTPGWVGRYLDTLRAMGTGIVSCADGYRDDELPTQWAMTSDVVRALGKMVPAPVDHLYCDNAIRDLARAAKCYAYLPDVLIEHMHPVARDDKGRAKGESDPQYDRVNSRDQYRNDRAAYRGWHQSGQAEVDVVTVRRLIEQGARA